MLQNERWNCRIKICKQKKKRLQFFIFEQKWSIFAYVTLTVIVDSLAQCVAGGTAFAPVRFLAERL